MFKKAIAMFTALTIAVICSACSSQASDSASNSSANDIDSATSSSSAATKMVEFQGLSLQIPEEWVIEDQGDNYIHWDCNGRRTAVFSVASYTWAEAGGEPAAGEARVDIYYSNELVKDEVVKGSAGYDSTDVGGLPARKVSYSRETSSLKVPVTELCVLTSKGFVIAHGEAVASVNYEFKDSFAAVFESVQPQNGEVEAFEDAKKDSTMSETEIDLMNSMAQGQIEDALKGENTWSNSGSSSASSAESSSNADSQDTSSSSSASSQAFKAGTYRIGTDCPAGEYKLTASGKGYFCVYPDTTKSDILENSNFDKCEYITVEDGQCLVVRNATFIALEDAKPSSGTLSGSGRYLVGFDCPAGEYKLTQTGGSAGYYCIHDNSTVNASIVQNNNFEGNDFCSVVDGQYLTLSRCTAEPA